MYVAAVRDLFVYDIAPDGTLRMDVPCRSEEIEQAIGKVEAHVADALAKGGRVLTGGQRIGERFYAPTVIADAAPGMLCAKEETFGPVAPVFRFETEAEAIALANGTDYGLQASVWSHDINRAHRVARALRAGTVHVNQYDEDDITVPFGGYRQSGNGRDKSLHALEKYTELKTTWLRIDA